MTGLSPRCVVITGASSGLGAALARAYAAPGIRLALLGRDTDRLAQMGAQCRDQGAQVDLHAVDVTDAAAMRTVLTTVASHGPVDLVIANAGIAAPGRETPEDERRIVDTNVTGLLNTLQPVVALMSAQGHGQIGIVSSLAGFRALGGPAAYAASKAFARLYGEALRGRLAGRGVGVTVICPGFVDTPMIDAATRQRLTAPPVPADQAARIIRRGLAANAARISFPAGMARQVWWLALAPVRWTDRTIRRRWRVAIRDKG